MLTGPEKGSSETAPKAAVIDQRANHKSSTCIGPISCNVMDSAHAAWSTRCMLKEIGKHGHTVRAEEGRGQAALRELCGPVQGPSDVAVEEVHAILRQIVARTLESEECKGLAQFNLLKREIATTAASSLEKMKEDARKMVTTMVEMERSYLTAEVFREILQSSSNPEGSELVRTLSGHNVSLLFALQQPSQAFHTPSS